MVSFFLPKEQRCHQMIVLLWYYISWCGLCWIVSTSGNSLQNMCIHTSWSLSNQNSVSWPCQPTTHAQSLVGRELLCLNDAPRVPEWDQQLLILWRCIWKSPRQCLNSPIRICGEYWEFEEASQKNKIRTTALCGRELQSRLSKSGKNKGNLT